MVTALGLGAVVLLILANGYFVAAEFAYVAAKRTRLEDRAASGDRRSMRAVQVHQRLSFMLSGAQLGITVTSLVVGFIAEPTLGRALEPVMGWIGLPEGSRFGVALTTGFIIATACQMVIGELAPKNLAIARPEQVARALAGSTWWFLKLTSPLIRLFDGSANRLLRAAGIEPVQELPGAVSAEELDIIVEESAERGKLTPEQAALLSRAIEFSSLRASAAMVPWNRVTTVVASLSCEHLRLMISDAFSRFPVVGAGNRLIGVVHVKDLLDVDDDHLLTTTVADITRAAIVVPENATLRVVLDTLRRESTEMAIVIDEYGAPAGVVTLEDLVEELVGEIGDEYDIEADDEPTIEPDLEGGWRVPGSMRMDEVERFTEVDLPDEDGYATVAGLFLTRFQQIPSVGDRVEIADAVLEVTAMEGWAITQLLLLPPTGGEDGEQHADADSDDRTQVGPGGGTVGGGPEAGGGDHGTIGVRASAGPLSWGPARPNGAVAPERRAARGVER